jgi:hypothetical protein
MKQTIKVASIGMIVGFAIALANANDNMSSTTQQPGTSGSTTSESTTKTESNTSGAMGSDTTGAGTMGNTTGSATGSTTGTVDWKSMKSCTDQNGVTYRKNEKGFKECINWMKKNHKGDMSGTMGTDSTSDSSGVTTPSTDEQAGTMGSEPSTPGTSVYDSGSSTGTGTSP